MRGERASDGCRCCKTVRWSSVEPEVFCFNFSRFLMEYLTLAVGFSLMITGPTGSC